MSDVTFDEIKNILKKMSESQAENQARADAEMAKLRANQDRNDAQIAANEVQLNKTMKTVDQVSKTVASVGKQLGGIGRSQGRVAEEFFYNSLRAKPVLGEVVFDTVLNNVQGGSKKHQAEFDVLMTNGNSAAVLEVKYVVRLEDLEHLEKNLKRYREVFPQHHHYKLYGGVAGFSVDAEVTQEAKRRGMFVLQRKGDVFTTDVSDMRVF